MKKLSARKNYLTNLDFFTYFLYHIAREVINGAGTRNRKQTGYLYNLYCFPHVAIVFCTDIGGWDESKRKLLQKSTNISGIVQHMRVSFVSLQSSRVCLQNSTVILRNIVEDLRDTAYQKYCKIVISKEVCLQYATLPLYVMYKYWKA